MIECRDCGRWWPEYDMAEGDDRLCKYCQQARTLDDVEWPDV